MALTTDDFHPDIGRRQSGELLRIVGTLDGFSGHWRKLKELHPERLAQLRQVTTIESAASSTRIEGAELSDADVAKVLDGVRVASFRARDEQEVLGYGELLTTIYEHHVEITLTESHVRQLHGILLGHSEKDERHRGQYKTVPNDVVRKEPGKPDVVLFETATPFDTPRRMAELVEATNLALAEPTLHPLVVVARFIVDFLAIHPFQDGNGRLARALTTLLLLRTGYEYVPYSSLERIIEESKPHYYASLRESQMAMRDEPAKFGAWLFYFLRALDAQQRSLATKLQVERSLLDLSEDQQRVAALVTARGRMTGPGIAQELSLPQRTVQYHLQTLVRRGVLAARGERRGRNYVMATAEPEAAPVAGSDGGTNRIIADVFERGGRISRQDLVELVRRHGYNGRVVGVLHGRRNAHLRRDPKTGESVLTGRGEEVARQHIFTARLVRDVRQLQPKP